MNGRFMFGIIFRLHCLLKQTGPYKEFSADAVAKTNRFSRYIYVAGNPAEEPLMEHFLRRSGTAAAGLRIF